MRASEKTLWNFKWIQFFFRPLSDASPQLFSCTTSTFIVLLYSLPHFYSPFTFSFHLHPSVIVPFSFDISVFFLRIFVCCLRFSNFFLLGYKYFPICIFGMWMWKKASADAKQSKKQQYMYFRKCSYFIEKLSKQFSMLCNIRIDNIYKMCACVCVTNACTDEYFLLTFCIATTNYSNIPWISHGSQLL